MPLSLAVKHVWNKKAGRFADKATGKFLSKPQVNKLLDAEFDSISDKIQKSAQKNITGRKSPDLLQFSLEVSDHIKRLHVISAVRANDGRADTLTSSQLQLLKTRISEQLTKGKDPITGDKFGILELVKDISKGNVSDAQLKNRLNMFVKSAELTKNHIIHEARKSDSKKALRVLGANHNHCSECLDYSSRGWVKLADLILPGQSCSCRSNCLCSVRYI